MKRDIPGNRDIKSNIARTFPYSSLVHRASVRAGCLLVIDCGYEVDGGQQVVHPAWTAFYDNVGCLIEARTL